MRNFVDRLARKGIIIISLIIIIYLTVNAFIYTSDGNMIYANYKDAFSAIIVCMILFFAIFGFVYFLSKADKKIIDIAVPVIMLITVAAIEIWWTVNSKADPMSDAKSVYDIAYRAMNRDLLPIAPTGSYMSLYPFQSGYLMYLETILRLNPGEFDYVTVQFIGCAFGILLVFSMYMICREIFDDDRSNIIIAVLLVIFVPIHLYVNNTYNDIPGLSTMAFAYWMLLRYIKHKKIIYGVLYGGAILASTIIRQSVLVYFIASVILFLISFITEKKKIYIVLGILSVALVYIGVYGPVFFYEHRAGNTMGKGMPKSAGVAMGLQWTNEAAGTWNGFQSALFIDNDFDTDKTDIEAKENIKESLKYMASNPKYAVSFFQSKLTTQWNKEDFGCNYDIGNLFSQKTIDKWLLFLAAQQNIVFVSLLGFIVLCRTKKMKFVYLIPLVNLIGGFIYSIMFEGGTRYVMPFYFFMFPFAAYGLNTMYLFLEKTFLSAKRAGNENA